MADNIVSVQTITASNDWTNSEKITLPKARQTSDSVIYIFSSLHSGTIELVQSGSTTGIELLSGTQYQSGPWRLTGGPPQYLYSTNASGEPCRVTVVLEV